MKRRDFLSSAIALPTVALSAPPRRPNLLFILADQWRPQSLPSSGDSDLHAPNLAKLAADGVHFDRMYASDPVCTPSRASMITGKYPRACRMPHNDLQLPREEKCIAQEFKNAAYSTGYIGKWHLDGEPRPGFVPPGWRRRGFDYWAGFNRGHFYFTSTYYRDTDQPIHRNDVYEPDYQTDLAIDFIKANKEKPFYLFLSWGPPHTPRTPPARYANYYKPAQFHLPPNVPAKYEATARKDRVGYYGSCSALDDNVGRLMAALDGNGLAGDTIVVFTADHGDMLGSHGLEFKGVPYEESAHIPFLMRYPRRLKSGRKDDLLMCNVDYMPTLLSMCGLKAPSTVQGRDLSRQILTGTGDRPESIYSEGKLGTDGEWHMVVRGKDKLVMNTSGEVTHLFNLAEDPFEMKNLAKEAGGYPKFPELKRLLEDWNRRAAG